MKKNVCRFFFVLIVVGSFSVTQVFAEIGLQQIAAGEGGALAVGQAVLKAATEIYKNNTDPTEIESQLITLLNEAAYLVDEQAVRYALVAILMAGGVEHIEQVTAAINSSLVASQYPGLMGLPSVMGSLMAAPDESARDGFVDPTLAGIDLENLFSGDLDNHASPG